MAPNIQNIHFQKHMLYRILHNNLYDWFCDRPTSMQYASNCLGAMWLVSPRKKQGLAL